MSIRLPQISSAQCKRARAMLKWNPQDLASRGRIQVKRIEMFERNQLRLTRVENDEIVSLFQKYHIDFRPGNEVVFTSNRRVQQTDAPALPKAETRPIIEITEMTLADGVTKQSVHRENIWVQKRPASKDQET